jgi:hypothetical protein
MEDGALAPRQALLEPARVGVSVRVGQPAHPVGLAVLEGALVPAAVGVD